MCSRRSYFTHQRNEGRGNYCEPIQYKKSSENTCIPIGCSPEVSCLLEKALRKLTRRMNTFKSLVISHRFTYKISINQVGKSNIGQDPVAAGLQLTLDGKPNVLDILDCTESGDNDTSTVVKVDADCCIHGASEDSLVSNYSRSNPSGDWHVGCKLVYELFTDTLTSRLKKQRKKTWDE